jgi:hypothetical protein
MHTVVILKQIMKYSPEGTWVTQYWNTDQKSFTFFLLILTFCNVVPCSLVCMCKCCRQTSSPISRIWGWTAKMESACSSKMLVHTHKTTEYSTPEDNNMNSCCLENLKLYKYYILKCCYKYSKMNHENSNKHITSVHAPAANDMIYQPECNNHVSEMRNSWPLL